MTKRALSQAQLAVVQAVRTGLVGVDAGARIVRVRVACSGGADSLALAAGLAWLDAREPDPLRRSCAMVVDHGLQDGSARVAASVVAVLSRLGMDAESARVAVPLDAPDGLEAAARRARYEVLTSGDANIVLVGHTMDDQAETVLLGLARGSGTRSLAGMPSRWTVGDVQLIRPLLGLRRVATRQACADWGLTPWDDPMNDDTRFARVRARRLLPDLDAALGPGIVEALGRTAALTRDDADYLDQAAAELLQQAGQPGSLPVNVLAGAPQALRGRLLRQWLAVGGVAELSYERTKAVLSLVDGWRGQAGVDLPGGRRVTRIDGELRLGQPVNWGHELV